LRGVNSSVLTMMTPLSRRSRRFALSAAGFIATSTSGASPGVWMSWSAMRTWKADTPGSVPAGARISAGKSGSVERSLPISADVFVNCVPVSCMPSPESPAKRMTTSETVASAALPAAVCPAIGRVMFVSCDVDARRS